MCGVFGLIAEDVTESIIQALVQLQHRGQDAAGIYTYNPSSGHHYIKKNLGLVNKVFAFDGQEYPLATCGIGHVRYSTIGKGSIEDAQPLYAQGKFHIAMAHNGNIVNYVPLRQLLESEGSSFTSSCDVEVILQQCLHQLMHPTFEDLCNAVEYIFDNTFGAYSVVMIVEGLGLVAFRDPHGIRPLSYGVRTEDNAHGFSSETSPLQMLEFDHYEDVAPGEVVLVTHHRQVLRRRLAKSKIAHCSFEYDYFAKPNAILDQQEVYRVRARLGEALGKKIKQTNLKADVVVPIPDTARPAALALARTVDLPIEDGFVKQGYVGRTFIMPTQTLRKRAVAQKLASVRSVFEGRDVIIVDDSIVRGTVSKRVVRLAREAGAKKVYFASTYPEIRHVCLYGVDFPDPNQLIAYNRTIEEICKEIEADGLIYNDVEMFKEAVALAHLCTACYTGDYPTKMDGMEELQSLREKNMREMELIGT